MRTTRIIWTTTPAVPRRSQSLVSYSKTIGFYVMIIYVHIKDKVLPINVGVGVQTINWLGSVAVSRYDDHFGLTSGLCLGMRLENK